MSTDIINYMVLYLLIISNTDIIIDEKRSKKMRFRPFFYYLSVLSFYSFVSFPLLRMRSYGVIIEVFDNSNKSMAYSINTT